MGRIAFAFASEEPARCKPSPGLLIRVLGAAFWGLAIFTAMAVVGLWSLQGH